jgi:prevent-host-death family protein
MRQIQATQLKSHLAELLRDVEHGEAIEITRHGKTVAHLVPPEADVRQSRREKMAAFLEARAKLPKISVTPDEIVSWIHEGRRY